MCMHLCVITAPHKVPNEAQLCNDMRKLGLTRLHLRKPGWTKLEAASFLSQLDTGTVDSVILHDWHDLAEEYPVKVLSEHDVLPVC